MEFQVSPKNQTILKKKKKTQMKDSHFPISKLTTKPQKPTQHGPDITIDV